MEAFLSRYRHLTVLVVVIIAQLILLAYQVKSNQDTRLIRVWAVTAITPVARVLETVRSTTVGFVGDYFVLFKANTENKQLHDELGKLKMENQFLRTELETAERARALGAFQARTPSRTIAARIIANGTGANSKVVFVDRGSVAGVQRGQAVVTPDGIVGKVLAVYPTAAQVLLITDPSFAAGVISQKNRVHGTLKGLGESKCLVDYVQNEEKVELGEWFYTSGDDRVFPKGLPAGEVRVLRTGKTFKEIYVVPSGFQRGLEEVLIVLEGVHQQIPDALPSASGPVSLLPAPSGTVLPATDTKGPSPLSTDADRLKERYRKIGEAQKHVFGEGVPGSRPPNFNLDPSQIVRPPVGPRAPQGTGEAAPGTPEAAPAKPQPPPPKPDSVPASPRPAPSESPSQQ